MDWVIGIDPGATGALAIFCPQTAEVLSLIDMPNIKTTLTTGKVTHRVAIEKLIDYFNEVIIKAVEKNIYLHVHIEQVQGFGKQSGVAGFNFGYAAAIPYAIAKTYKLDVSLVPPQTWKAQFGILAEDKDASRMLVRQMFPALKYMLQYKYNVDRADAVLIAAYKRSL